MEDGLRAVRRLDDDVRLCEAALDVAALVRARVGVSCSLRDRLLGIEQRLEHLVLDVDEGERRAGLAERVGGDGRDRLALVVATR